MTVPAALERGGDFSQTYYTNATLAVIYDPNTGTSAANRTDFAGNKIPASRLDPVALNVIKAYPLSNRIADNIAGANNFTANAVNVLDRDNVTAKLDYNLTDAHKFTGRYLWNRQGSGIRSVYADPGAETSTISNGDGWNLLGSWTAILRSAIINRPASARRRQLPATSK